jgi:hypothetical protein
MQKAGQDLIPDQHGSCAVFSEHVRNVEAAVILTHPITAYAAVREQDRKRAAERWQEVVRFCAAALGATKKMDLLGAKGFAVRVTVPAAPTPAHEQHPF